MLAGTVIGLTVILSDSQKKKKKSSEVCTASVIIPGLI